VAQFAVAAREAVASGIAVSNAAAFAAELRRAGDLLARSGTGDEEALATELDSLTAALQTIQPGAPAPAAVAPVPRPAPALARAPAPARPAAPAAPVAKAPAAARAAAPAPSQRADLTIPETPDLVGSWAAYQRLVAGGIGTASIAELVAGAERAPSQARDTARPATAEAPVAATAEATAVDVRTLLYRGDRALRRAQELRAAAKQASGDALRELVDEVCDLVALALEPSP